MFIPDRYPSRRGKGDLGLHFQEGSSRFPEACKRERERERERERKRRKERKKEKWREKPRSEDG